MQLVPQDGSVIDPTPFLYNTSLYGAVGLVVIATIANLTVRPVNAKWFTRDALAPPKEAVANGTWIITVDGTPTSDHVFFWAVTAMKEKNLHKLKVLMVDPPVDKGTSAFKPYIPVLDGEPHFSVANILQKYVTYGQQLGIEVIPILVTSTDIGEGVVAAVKFQKPDVLVIGTKKRPQNCSGKILHRTCSL